jgi:multidrug efflux pump subunit AcrA (membrane-fusion protein)
VEVTVAIDAPDDQRKAAGYALASVDVTFTAAERKDVLAVPVAALVSLPDGGFGVEVVEGGATRYVPVRTGLFSGGWVEVTGDGLAPGATVGIRSPADRGSVLWSSRPRPSSGRAPTCACTSPEASWRSNGSRAATCG